MRYLLIYTRLMMLWNGVVPGDTGRVRGGPPGLMSPDSQLVLGNHGGNGEQILW